MSNTYTPPKVWTWEQPNGGAFASVNRPVSGATHDKTLPVGEHDLQLYSMATPNGVKVTMLLEELLEAGHQAADYDAWLTRHGVNTSHALVSTEQHTAHFTVTTDTELNQIASFFPGAMSEARNIELKPIMDKVGKLDLLVVSPDDPEAMLRHTEVALSMGVAVAADPSQQMARMSGEEIKKLIAGATYLFMNEYELALAIQKTGWSDREILEQVKYRVVTLGSEGARVESLTGKTIKVTCPKEKSKTDPTGVGDSFRSGFVAGLAWGLSHERCAQLGSMIATYVIETTGTQEYRFTSAEFLARFKEAYGASAAAEIEPHLPKL